MKIWTKALLALLICSASAIAEPTAAERRAAWNEPQSPFRIIGNVYYVGTEDLGVYLIVSSKGDVLIDGGLEESAVQIEHNIAALGVQLSDIKLIVNTHAHFDHAGGIAKLKHDSGADFAASAGDRPILQRGSITYGPSAGVRFPSIRVNKVVADGETVGIGNALLTAHLTPGHTPGCTTWTMTVQDQGIAHDVVFYCSTTVAGNPLVNNQVYPTIVADYRASFAKLKTLKADVFLKPHAEFFDLQKKLAARDSGKADAFIDPGEFQRFVAASEADFEKELVAQTAAAPPPAKPK